MNINDFRRVDSRGSRAAGIGAALLCLVTVGWPHHAAAVAIYKDRAAWTAAVAATITMDTFSNDIAFGQSITFDSGVASTGSGTNSTVLADSNTVAGGSYSGRVDAFNHSGNTFAGLTWNFPILISALGGDWNGAATGGRLTLTGDFDGTGDQPVNLFDTLGSPGTGFLGIIGAAEFSSITLGTQTNQLDEIFFLDNLSFALAAVPEPAPYWLVALGLAGLGPLRRRSPR